LSKRSKIWSLGYVWLWPLALSSPLMPNQGRAHTRPHSIFVGDDERFKQPLGCIPGLPSTYNPPPLRYFGSPNQNAGKPSKIAGNPEKRWKLALSHFSPQILNCYPLTTPQRL
jgi:hypothetical protein